MDQRAGYYSQDNVTPAMLSLKLDFSQENILQTMKSVEKAYWDYLDNYNSKRATRYPYIPMYIFLDQLLRLNHMDTRNVNMYCKIYDKYKKSLPTAGVILFCGDNFVVVRMKTARTWSMPKGKKDATESIEKTAVREFCEETGIDLDDLITSSTPKRNICKTLFYFVEADHMQSKFSGYDCNEIGDVKWVSTKDVLNNATWYSRQTVSVAQELQNFIKSRA